MTPDERSPEPEDNVMPPLVGSSGEPTVDRSMLPEVKEPRPVSIVIAPPVDRDVEVPPRRDTVPLVPVDEFPVDKTSGPESITLLPDESSIDPVTEPESDFED